MKLYWKVHISNYDNFIRYVIKLYVNFSTNDMYYFSSSYDRNDYLYILIQKNTDGSYRLSFTGNSDNSRNWLGDNGWIYQCEYRSRKEKLERLDVVFGRL